MGNVKLTPEQLKQLKKDRVKTMILQLLPILLVVIFIGASWYWEIEYGYWGYAIVIPLMALLVWFGFFRKRKK